ncbi:MAG: CopG family transcriptional regulator [Epsilonproteobacteria bacterium]|nr:CopG family transcriptional regulator [Campylobacterota bacterium]
MLAVRLNEKLEQELAYFSKLYSQTKTDVVREALTLYFKVKREEETKSPFELGKDLFGRYDSGEHNLSTTYKQKIKDKLRAKQRTNR